ncbi:MAG: hypothetical protein ACI81P_000936 [Neolewinella sp.]|jgi:hypothetical protein
MKSLLYLTLLLGSTSLFAQASYQQALGQALGQFSQAQSPEQYGASATAFTELGNAEGATWHANYYAALATVAQSFRTEETKDRDRLVSEAQVYLNLAKEAGTTEAESVALQARIYQARISIDPASRSMQYGPKTMGMLFPAKAKSPGNPRLLLLLAQMVERTPVGYGGGPEKALSLVQGSMAAFEVWSSEDPFAPSWGQDEAAKLLGKLDPSTAKSRKK